MDRIVSYVEEGSVASLCGIRPGDVIVSINGMEDFDIIDYLYASADSDVDLAVRDGSGVLRHVRAQNDGSRPFGISFQEITADRPRLCRNHCVFCFMDQMPKGLRRSLYFKDDDYRLSFLMGNYITLTNVSDEELERICRLKLSPLNISVHVTDPDLRRSVMGNPDAGKIMDQLRKLAGSGITYNIQLVLCPGLNDGEYLERSLEDMISLLPAVESLACVPVGLTRFRSGLGELSSYSREQACRVIDTVDSYAKKAREISPDTRFCASDEFFLLAGRDFPPEEYYGDYAQYENGVGMARSFIDSAMQHLDDAPSDLSGLKAVAVTGTLGEKVISPVIGLINEKRGCDITVASVPNAFFGESVTASGLVCGCDILARLSGLPDERIALIPSNMLKDDEDVFLDGMSLEELRERSGRRIEVVSPDGWEFCEQLGGLIK
ncbi:MAG: DUF512 domain-containing protein [Eubacteriaceae bacterium]|nr:DUF512 domain-containing protein [Eubacteriaceae bacterium]